MSYSRGLILSLLIHCLLGSCNVYLGMSLNVLKEYVMPFANQSFYDHYGVVLDHVGFSWLWSSLQGLLLVGFIVAPLTLTPLMDIIGRRNTCMFVANGFLLGSIAMQMMAKSLNSVELFGIGQILCGLSCGSNRVVFQLFSESAPIDQRGSASFLYSGSCAAWTVVGIVFAFPILFGSHEMWPFFFAPAIVPCVLYFICASFVHESPKFLYLHKRNREKAIKAIRFYHGNNADVDKVLAHYDDEIVKDVHQHKATVSYRNLLTNPLYRTPFLLCLLTNVAINLQGSSAFMSYGNGIALQLGMSPKESLIMMLVTTAYFVTVRFIVAIIGINRFGRISLLILCSLLSMIGGLFLGLIYALKQGDSLPHWLAILFLLAFSIILLTNAGISPNCIATLLIGEYSPYAIAGKVHQACALFGCSTDLLIILTFPPLMARFGSAVPIFYACVGALSAVVFHNVLPETRGKQVDELMGISEEQEFEKKPLQPEIGTRDYGDGKSSYL